MELKVDAMVVVPGLGVGRVGALEELDIGEQTVRAFPVNMGDSGVYWVPEDRVDDQGLRAPMDADTAASIIEELADHTAPKKRASWRARQKRYQEMLTSNRPMELAALVGELAAVRRQKREKKQTLSFSERRLLEQAKELLIGEIQAVTGRARDALERAMTQALAPA